MGVVFGIECGSTGLGEPIVPSLAIGPPQTLEREPLATGVAGMKHFPYTASAQKASSTSNVTKRRS